MEASSLAVGDTSCMTATRFVDRPREDYEAYRFARALGPLTSHAAQSLQSPSPVSAASEPPPPGAGVGGGLDKADTGTSPDPALAATPELATTPAQLPRLTPMMPQAVDHVMHTMADTFFMSVDEHEHLAWLLTSGLIGAADARNVLSALGVPLRPQVESPLMLQAPPTENVPGSGTSVSINQQGENASQSPLAIEAAPLPCTWTEALPQRLELSLPPVTARFPESLPALPPLPAGVVPAPAPPAAPAGQTSAISPSPLQNLTGLSPFQTPQRQGGTLGPLPVALTSESTSVQLDHARPPWLSHMQG